jgi:hypothetical protein
MRSRKHRDGASTATDFPTSAAREAHPTPLTGHNRMTLFGPLHSSQQRTTRARVGRPPTFFLPDLSG